VIENWRIDGFLGDLEGGNLDYVGAAEGAGASIWGRDAGTHGEVIQAFTALFRVVRKRSHMVQLLYLSSASSKFLAEMPNKSANWEWVFGRVGICRVLNGV
jgi:hypothetical protein